MRAVVCRVHRASVSVDGQVVGSIAQGLLVFVAVVAEDDERDAERMAERLPVMRLFQDDAGKMNRSVVDLSGGLLLISNFTVAGRTRKGTRPSFTDAAGPDAAQRLFEHLADRCAEQVTVATGRFGAHMDIDASFDGPVTVILDTRRP